MISAVEMVEVGPRDGLQNEKTIVSTADKVELIRRAIGYGARRIEIASFVNPRKVPQMADAEDVVAQLGKVEGLTRIGLVLNERGAERALACGIDQLGAVAIASDAFGIRNQGQDSATSVEVAKRIMAMAQDAGRTAQVTIAVSFGCPFAGEVDPARVVAMAGELAASGPVEIALADTIGVAAPGQVADLVRRVKAAIGTLPLRVHFHDTRNTANANIWAAVENGAAVVDAALGGLGGCPFAPGAAGNVATEDAVYSLERSGISTGLDLPAIREASHWLAGVMGKQLPSKLADAAPFPPEHGAE
ncbi:MAG: hydroxymethylglutaryl-CoA lyase [Sphingomonadales bacterium]|jgi:hydroxymethylglutaryl-CoA lyase|nr:hydroxymethylglutaryl-CoA lyase [Sphingomonadales bacterium]MBK9002395.1 hydroxymethylglutaryl-CoA lyase [Sphingomonadales bacterium]MBK9267625.1 hydroxymethylglutaryl-CoA lyase [Sphingomonadales bacterium]MBP6434810.1 hydroxymethylglutaryl-CoA lyase [Sphingorhabdus sp.]